MKNGVAKRTLGVVLSAAMVATTAGTIPGVDFTKTTVAHAAGGDAIYVDSTNYYDSDYDNKYAYNGDDLGCTYTKDKVTFKVWSPEADSVKIHFYATGSDKEAGAKNLKTVSMNQGKNGVWSYETADATEAQGLLNKYYTYDAVIGGISYGETADPYAKAVGVNGDRSMVVDLDSTDPENWDKDYNSKRTATALSDVVVWEVHIRDFSIDASSGVSEKNRGKYKAFTESDTSVNKEGKVASCVKYLKQMGVTHVQLLPTFDYDGVDETKITNEKSKTNYNWGYNPKNYNVPDGAYASNPYDGNVRIKEMKEMIQALHNAGIKVIMDVVYNHTYATADSCFNKIMPDYYYKLTGADGKVTYNDESGCGNATRSDSAMFKKYMIDSLNYWADEYHIDGFRFDLMGIHAWDTMNAIRRSLDANFGKDTIVMYGEGWTGGGYEEETSCYKSYCRKLDKGIGYFNDQIRDAIKGETSKEKAKQIGFAQQNFGLADVYTDHEKFPTSVFGGIMGSVGKNKSDWWMWRAYWADTSARVLSYDSCHDNMTVWDKFVESMDVKNADQTALDFNTTDQNLINMSRMTAGYLLSSHGGVFLHAGEEFARTKNGNENSYNAGDLDNALDWNRVNQYAALTDYYQGMVAIRKAFSGFRNIIEEKANAQEVKENTKDGFFNTANVNGNNITEIDSFTEVVEDPDNQDKSKIQSVVNSIGYYLSNDKEDEWKQVAVLLNNTKNEKTASLEAADGSTDWVVVSDGKQASVAGVNVVSAAAVTVPGKSVVIAVPKKTFDASKKFVAATQIVPYDPASEKSEVVEPEPTQTAIDEDEVDGPLTLVGGDVTVLASATPTTSAITETTTVPTAVPTTAPTTAPAGQTSNVAPVSVTDLTLAPNALYKAGQKITVSATAAGGTGTYTYQFYVYKNDALVYGTGEQQNASYEFKPTTAGVYTIRVAVKDTEGRIAEKETAVLVAAKLTASVNASKKVIKKGEKITFKITAKGGTTPYKYTFTVLNSKGKIVKKSGSISKGTWTWKATKKGTYQLKITVKDKGATVVKKTIDKIVVKVVKVVKKEASK